MQKRMEWSTAKNEWLTKNRGVCFEDVISALDSGSLLAIEKNSKTKYSHQYVYIIKMKEYVYIVPFVEDTEKIFLKTIYASRVVAKKYLKNK